MIYVVPIRDEHTQNGSHTSPEHCALAIAIREAHPDIGRPFVTAHQIALCDVERGRILRYRTRLRISPDVSNFVRKYTVTTFPARPFTLVLDTGAETAFRFDSLTHHRPGAINWFGEKDFGEADGPERTRPSSQ